MTRVDELYDDLVRRELLDSQLSGHQWAVFFEGQMLSCAFHDLSSLQDNHDDWSRTTRRMSRAAVSERVPAPD
jgi:hypothetical protein